MVLTRRSKRILWVDDEIELLRPHCLFLQHKGYYVDAITNGDDALTLEDFFLVYPTKLREYQSRYRGEFLHGGVSPEEMIVPVATLTPRSR